VGRTEHCSALRGAFLYEGPARSLVVKFKYGGRPSLAEALGAWMSAVPFPAPDALAPVPLHPKRLRERGYNQAERLAREVARRRGLPLLPALERVRASTPQAELGRDQRLVNLEGAYRTSADVKGMTLLLIDDVGTTGATLEECAKALLAAGARSVEGLVFARDL
jgi:ComF family protein